MENVIGQEYEVSAVDWGKYTQICLSDSSVSLFAQR